MPASADDEHKANADCDNHNFEFLFSLAERLPELKYFLWLEMFLCMQSADPLFFATPNFYYGRKKKAKKISSEAVNLGKAFHLRVKCSLRSSSSFFFASNAIVFQIFLLRITFGFLFGQ